MIDVQLQPFGRSLVAMYLGTMKYQAAVNEKNIKNFEQEIKNINTLERNRDMFTDISFDITSNLIDKRFTTSKKFIQSGGNIRDFQFKKSTIESDRHLQYVTEKNALQSRARLNTAVSQHNKRITDTQTKASFKLINLKPIFK